MPIDTSVSFGCLVTPAQVAAAWQSGVEAKADDPALAAICEGVSREIEGYLDRRLIVHVATVSATGWTRDLPGYGYYLGAWPYVDAPPTGWTASAGQFITADRRPSTPTPYHAGYRRADMGLEDVQAAYPSLAVLPPLVPYDITQLAIDYALYLLGSRGAGVGVERSEVQMGAGTITRTRARATWWEENRRRIDHHRRLTL